MSRTTIARRSAVVVMLAGFGTAATAGTAVAEPEPAPRRQLSLSFMGLAGFLRINAGTNTLAYEQPLGAHHAVRIAGDFIHVHHAADHVQAHQWTYGASVSYRYHLHDDGLFLGLTVGYRRGVGHFGDRGTPEHTMLTNRQLRVLPELGVRVPHPRLPLAFVTSVAAGWGPYTVATDRDDATGRAAAQYCQDVLAATPLIVEVEASLAYRF